MERVLDTIPGRVMKAAPGARGSLSAPRPRALTRGPGGAFRWKNVASACQNISPSVAAGRASAPASVWERARGTGEGSVSDLNMSEEFRAGCAKLGITEDLLRWSLGRSGLAVKELLTIDTTTSSRNYRISYVNQEGEKKWAHLFIVPGAPFPTAS